VLPLASAHLCRRELETYIEKYELPQDEEERLEEEGKFEVCPEPEEAACDVGEEEDTGNVQGETCAISA
jgi:hypothetical protein